MAYFCTFDHERFLQNAFFFIQKENITFKMLSFLFKKKIYDP